MTKNLSCTNVCDSLFFRTFEYKEFCVCKGRAEENLRVITEEIKKTKAQLETQINVMDNKNLELTIAFKRRHDLLEQHPDLNVSKYVGIQDEIQLLSALNRDFKKPGKENDFLAVDLACIATEKHCRKLDAKAMNLKNECDRLKQTFEDRKAIFGQLTEKIAQLSRETGRFILVREDLQKFRVMTASLS